MNLIRRNPVASVAAIALFAAIQFPELGEASLISFNSVGSATPAGMQPADTAGAPGVSAANWNNMVSSATAGGAIAGSIAAGGVVDNSGTTLAATTVTWTGTGQANTAGSGTNDQRMFESEWDLFNNAGPGLIDMTVTVTNIPYAQYDVYFYVQDASNAADRGGDIIANGVRESIMMYNFPSGTTGVVNPLGPFGYVEADYPFTYNDPLTPRGTYVQIEDLSGDLTLQLDALNTSTPRLRMSGFQIVEVVPEPSTGLALAGIICWAISARRRRSLSFQAGIA